MPGGTAIDRQWIVVLEDGTPILDWDNGLGLNLLSGEYIRYQQGEYTRAIQDDELEMLKRAGRVSNYNHRQVFILGLPEAPIPPSDE